MAVARVRAMYQNQRKTKIFSLMMLRARMHMLSCLVTVPDGPYM